MGGMEVRGVAWVTRAPCAVFRVKMGTLHLESEKLNQWQFLSWTWHFNQKERFDCNKQTGFHVIKIIPTIIGWSSQTYHVMCVYNCRLQCSILLSWCLNIPSVLQRLTGYIISTIVFPSLGIWVMIAASLEVRKIITVDPWLYVTVLYVICKPCLENMNAPQKERNLFFKKVARLLQ